MTNSATEASQERQLRARLRESLAEWCRFVLREEGHEPAPHQLKLIEALQDVAEGRIRRLMVLMPPGSAKSTYTSLLFPPWWMARRGGGAVICASHTQSLAQHFGRGVRRLITSHGARLNVRLRKDARAAERFTSTRGGEYFAIGAQGAVAGRRADLIIIDDPVASFAACMQPRAREATWDWYRADLVTRLRPEGSIILVMTRWHSDDLAGRLIAAGDWTVLRMPALAEEGDALGRPPGAALWPGYETAEALAVKRRELGEFVFSALYQQNPAPKGVPLFQPGRIALREWVPGGMTVRAWDLAATPAHAGNPDWTVGLKLTRLEDGEFCVADIRRMRGTPNEVADVIRRTARDDGEAVTIGLPRDPGQAGNFQASALAALLAGYKLEISAEQGAKAIRAMPVAAQISADNFSMKQASWNRGLSRNLPIFRMGRRMTRWMRFHAPLGCLPRLARARGWRIFAGWSDESPSAGKRLRAFFFL